MSGKGYVKHAHGCAVLLALTCAPLLAQGAATEEGTGLKMYGYVMADFIYDFNRVDPNWNATLRPSKIPVNCPGDPGCGSDGETIFSVRQTRLGFKGQLSPEAGGANFLLEFDLFGLGGGTGQTQFHLRHAFGELGKFGAGQTWTLLKDSDAAPTTLDYWGPIGQFSSLKAQVRWTPYRHEEGDKLAVALEVSGAALDEGNVTTVFPDLNVREKTGTPDLTAQYHNIASWGHWQIAGILRRIEFDTPMGESGQETGYGGNLTGALKIGAKDKLQAQVAYGRGVASYFSDCCVDIGPDENFRAKAVPLTGWLLYYDHAWSDRWRSVAGYSEARQDNTANQTASAMERGRYASANLLYTVVKNVLVGGEFLWGERRNKDGASGDDRRLQFSAKYEF